MPDLSRNFRCAKCGQNQPLAGSTFRYLRRERKRVCRECVEHEKQKKEKPNE